MKMRTENPETVKEMLREDEIMTRYGIGRSTARKIGKESGARVVITPKCVRYRVDKLNAYIAERQNA